MPELPDIRLYIDLLRPRLIGATLRSAAVRGVSLLRTFDPPPDAAEGSRVVSLSRLGKRVAISFENQTHFVIHLMIAGRFRWADAVPPKSSRPRDDFGALGPPEKAGEATSRATASLPSEAVSNSRQSTNAEANEDPHGLSTTPSRGTPVRPLSSRIDQALFTFDTGTLTLTEAGTKKRASVHVVRGPPSALTPFNPGGLDLFACSDAEFAATLRSENRTIKRALTDPRLIDGVGNAYSDEILHAARMSPTQRTANMDVAALATLLHAARETLEAWTNRLRAEFGLSEDIPAADALGTGTIPAIKPRGRARAQSTNPARFPGRFPGPGEITAFRPGFAVHGKYGQPCPVCSTKVQRILYAENECNYCPRCQTDGKLLADRAMSRLLKSDWPQTIEELEGIEPN